MVEHPQFGSPTFRLVVRGLVELHGLIKDGKDESPAAEDVRDALEAPLKALSRTEKLRAQWLSEDLYSVSDPPLILKEMNPQAQHQLNEAIEARQRGDWDRALDTLRRWREYISPALLSYMRARIWSEAGYPEAAVVFFRHAAQSDPTNANYSSLYMDALGEVDPSSARTLAREVLADDSKFPPKVVAQAANIRFQETSGESDAESIQLYRELISLMERNLARIEQEGDVARRSWEYEITVGKLGMCHQLLGNSGAAVDYFSRGLQANPHNDGLLVARGILLYGASPRAITDLEQAVERRSPVVWPYLFLAHHYLTTNRFEHCRFMCEAGLRIGGSDTVKSQLEEWRAIAQAELGFPPDLVRMAFEAAVRLDPSNEIANRNQDAFERSLKLPHTTPRALWEKKSAASVRQFGLAERRSNLAA